MRRFLNNRISNYNNVGDKVDDFCEDCENKWLPFSRVWWDSTEKNIANIKRKDNGIFVIKKILSLINSISESIKDIYDRINTIESPILSEKLIELENDYLEVGVTADDKQEDLNIAIYENYINLKNTKVNKPIVESTSDSLKIVALDNQGESVFIKSSEVGKVKSVNNKIGDVILKTSDLENDSDYTTNATLTAHTSNKANPHNVTKSQIGLGNIDNTSDLNKPISTATQIELNKKLDKPTTNNTNQFVILGDGSTAAKGDLGKNFANTDLVISENRKHTGTTSVELAMPMIYSNAIQRFPALADKSADATFTEIFGSDSNGNMAKVGSSAIVGKLQNASQVEINTLFNTLNGAYVGISAIVVNAIYPLFITPQSTTQELILIGKGLNIVIDDLITKVRLINLTNVNALPIDVAFNPINQNKLIVYINEGDVQENSNYKIEIIAGVQRHVTSSFFEVVSKQKFHSVPSENLQWEIKDIANSNEFSIDENYIKLLTSTRESAGNIPVNEAVFPITTLSTDDYVLKFSYESSLYGALFRSKLIMGVRDKEINFKFGATDSYIGNFVFYNGAKSTDMQSNVFGLTSKKGINSIVDVIITKRGDTFSYSDSTGLNISKANSQLKTPVFFLAFTYAKEVATLTFKDIVIKSI